MSDTSGLDELKELNEQLTKLLSDPHPGLHTWKATLSKVCLDIGDFGGIGMVSAMPVLLTVCKSAVDYFNCSQSRQRWLDDNKMSPLVHLKLAIAKAEESK